MQIIYGVYVHLFNQQLTQNDRIDINFFKDLMLRENNKMHNDFNDKRLEIAIWGF
jgi:hypothetical protein